MYVGSGIRNHMNSMCNLGLKPQINMNSYGIWAWDLKIMQIYMESGPKDPKLYEFIWNLGSGPQNHVNSYGILAQGSKGGDFFKDQTVQ